MESFEIPDPVHKLFINSSKTSNIMNKDMIQENECPDNVKAYEVGTKLQEYLGVWIVCIFSIVGILLNTLCIRASASILASKKDPKAQKNPFNMLLLNLLSWDTIFLVLNIARKMENLVNKVMRDDYKCSGEILIALWNIALAQSVFATLLMSIERYICIVHEKMYSKYIQFENGRMILFLQWVMPMTLLVFLIHIPEFLSQNPDVKIEFDSECTRKEERCGNVDPKALNVDVYFKVGVKVFIDGIFPLICLSYCNATTFLKVSQNIRKSLRESKNIDIRTPSNSQEKPEEENNIETRPLSNDQKKIEEKNNELIRAIEHKLAKIMIGIVSVFILCQIPYLILTAVQSMRITKWMMGGKDTKFGMYPPSVIIMEPIVHLMLTVNCSVNVIFYCFFDSGYRNRIFPCIKNNQESGRKTLGISQEKDKGEDAIELSNSLTSPEKNVKDHSNRDHLFVNES